MTKHTIAIGDKTTSYWTYGDATNTPILMVHGFRGTHHGLEKLAGNLSGLYVVVPDLPGFGESQPLASHSLEQYTRWLGGFIEKLKFNKRPVLLGHSFGSIITAHFAATHAKKIDKLILINPIGAPALKGPQAILTQAAILYYFVGRKLPARASKRWLGNVLFVDTMSRVMTKSPDKVMKQYVKDQHRTHFSTFANSKVVAESFRASVSHDVREVAADISSKTLLIAGEKDDITSLQKQRELAAEIPRSTLQVISEVGHLIHYETATEAADIIQAWTEETKT